MQPERTCTRCGFVLPVEDFYLTTTGKPAAECKECAKARVRVNKSIKRVQARAAKEAEEARLRALSHKVCTKCKTEKHHDEFYLAPKRGDGFHSWCKDCARAAVRAHNARNGPRKPGVEWAATLDVAKAIATEAKTRPCVDCTQSFPPQIMHFHHRDPATKTAGIAKLVRTRPRDHDLIRAEIAKCDVLCPNCHALRHLREEEAA